MSVNCENAVPFTASTAKPNIAATIDKTEVPLRIQGVRFPAQQVQISELPSGLTLEPAQVELSMSEDGSKLQTIQLKNGSSLNMTISLRAIDEDGNAMKTVAVRPGRIQLSAKATRRVSVTAHPSAYKGRTTFCRVEAIIDGAADQVTMPVMIAVVGREQNTPGVTPGSMRLDTSSSGQFIVVPLSNSGGVHLPVSGQIIVTAENGTRHELLAGFGRWLLPGANTELRSQLPVGLADGQYQMTTDIEFGLRLAAIQRTDPIEFPIRVAAEPTPKVQR